MNAFAHSPYDLNDPQIVAAIDDLPLWSAPFGQKILDVVRMQKNITVIDVGCGLGFPLVELSQRLGETCSCYGIDPWAEALRRVKVKINAWGISNLIAIKGVAEALPFKDNCVDVILSNNGINNVADDHKTMIEIARVAKAGAQLVITVNLPETFVEFYTVFERILLEQSKRAEIKKAKEHIYSKRKPIDYTKNLVAAAGFTIQDIYTDEFTFRYTDGSAMLNHFFIKLAFLPSWLEILEKQDAPILFHHIEGELNKIASHQGELRLRVPWMTLVAEKRG